MYKSNKPKNEFSDTAASHCTILEHQSPFCLLETKIFFKGSQLSVTC